MPEVKRNWWQKIKHFVGKNPVLSTISNGLLGDKWGITQALKDRGYGRKRRVAPKRGRGITKAQLLRALGIRTVKKRRVAPKKKGRGIGSLLGALLGGKKRVSRRRGRGFFGDLWGGVKNIGSAIAAPAANMAFKALTGGRKKRVGRPRGRGFGDALGNMLRGGLAEAAKNGVIKLLGGRKKRGRGVLGDVWGAVRPHIRPGANALMDAIGLGRKRRVGRPRGRGAIGYANYMTPLGGFPMNGGRKRRVGRPRGRGIFGSALGSLLPF